MKNVCIIGHFGFGKELLNGQTVKTKAVAQELETQFGSDQIIRMDTHGGLKALLRLPFQCLRGLGSCRNVVILPAQNGLRVIAPLLIVANMLFSRKLHYVVIGGWLPEFLKTKPFLAFVLRKMDGIYVETSVMKRTLESLGFRNTLMMPNYKKLVPLAEKELNLVHPATYRLCTFSRVMQEKGIEDAVWAVSRINEELGRSVYTLDIYGQVDPAQTEWFEGLRGTFPDEIRYCGAVSYEKSVEVLKDYFALLFPTKFWTEGIPGTIIDAYAAGIPVIASRWESFNDIIEEGKTGIGYPFGEIEGLKKVLLNLRDNPEQAISMKRNCLARVQQYLPEAVVDILVSRMKETS